MMSVFELVPTCYCNTENFEFGGLVVDYEGVEEVEVGCVISCKIWGSEH
jgi:hypothetical protein